LTTALRNAQAVSRRKWDFARFFEFPYALFSIVSELQEF